MRVGGDVAAPVKLFAPQPRYTEMARKAREEGIVIVEAVIDETGTVTGAKIVKGLRFGLNEEALGAVERWRFEPATLNGRPIRPSPTRSGLETRSTSSSWRGSTGRN